MLASEFELTPKGGTKINFGASTVFARKIVVNKKPIMLTGKHKGMRATLDSGWMIIEQEWYSASV
ncbi:MAG: hypothetical protein WBV70_03945 [Candidatus Bathyarchaeia archaeon]